MSNTPNPPGNLRTVSDPAADVYPIRVICDFSQSPPQITVDPEEANPKKNQRVKFICPNAELVIIPQYHSKGSKESDHSPFAGDLLSLQIPINSGTEAHVTVKGDSAQPPPDRGQHHKHAGYKYTVVAVSAAGQVGVYDPTIIIR